MPNDVDFLPKKRASANRAPSVASLPWDTSAPWVAFNAWLYTKNGAKPKAGEKTLELTDEGGKKVVISRAELEANYFAVDEGASWKPRYVPVRALVMQDSGMFATPDGAKLKVKAGDAILFDGSAYTTLSAKDYKAKYVTVGFAGTPKPRMPFETTGR